MEEKTGRTEDELMKWSVYRYQHRLRYYAWQADTVKKYNDIMTPKK